MDFDLNQRRRQGKILPRKIPLSLQVKKSMGMLLGTLVFLLIILSIVYLMNTTQSSQKGYTLKQEQLRKDDLQLEKRELINKINDAKSMQKVEENQIIQEMIKPEEPIYIEHSIAAP